MYVVQEGSPLRQKRSSMGIVTVLSNKFTPSEFLGLPAVVVTMLKDTLTYNEYLKVAIAILEMRKQETKDDYQSDLFKYRSKVADKYREWLGE